MSDDCVTTATTLLIGGFYVGMIAGAVGSYVLTTILNVIYVIARMRGDP